MNPIQISAIIAAVCSLPVVWVSGMRLKKDRDILSLILFLASLFLTSTFISAFFHHIGFIVYLLNPENIQEYYFSPWFVGIPLILASIVVSFTMYLVVKKTTVNNLWRVIAIVLLAFIAFNMVAGLVGSLLFGEPFSTCFFESCCWCMAASGFAWGLTYEEICVIGNLYMQSGIVLASALYLLWACYKRNKNDNRIINKVLLAIGGCYTLVTAAGFVGVCLHYNMPMPDAFDLCVRELNLLAAKYDSTYYNVNFMIFIVLFLAVVLFNLASAGLINKRRLIIKNLDI